jgi:hypothetical protein
MAGELQLSAIPSQHAWCAGGGTQANAGIAVHRTTTTSIASAPFLSTFIA